MHKTRFAFVALALLTLLPAVASAQIDIGIRGGLSLANVGGDGVTDADSLGSRTGLNIGAWADVGVNDMFSVQIGAAYVEKGTTASFGGVDFDTKLTYLEIPVLAKISPSMSGSLGVDFFIGPSLGFNLSCKESVGSGASVDCDSTAGSGLDIKSTDFSGVGGAGINFAAGDTGTLVLQGFYTYGFTNIDNETGADSVKNKGWYFLAGFSIPVGG